MTAGTRQRPAWRVRLANVFVTPTPRRAWIVLVILAALLGVALAIVLVGQRPQPPFSAGLLAYSREGDVFLANPDGSSAIRVVHDPGVVFSAPVWSPDGRWLALEGGGGVFVLDPQTLSLQRVAAGSGAAWSSDASSLAVIKPSQGLPAIEIVDVETGTRRDLRTDLAGGSTLGTPLVWSRDGRWFLARAGASSGVTLVRIDAVSGATAEVAPMYHLAEAGAHWSSEPKRFAFARPDPCDQPPCESSIVVEDADLSKVIAVSDPVGIASNPVWSPDDAWIAFTSRRPGEAADSATISIVRPDGRDLRILTNTPVETQSLAWSADGTELDFLSADPSRGMTAQLTAIRIGDRFRRTVDTAAAADGYGWQAVPAGRPLPSVPGADASPSFAEQTTGPLATPPSALPADAAKDWAGLALDSYCDAGVLDLRAVTFQTVGSVCPTSESAIAFAPGASAYAMSGSDGSVTIVRGDGTAVKALDGIAAVDDGSSIQLDLVWSPDGRWLSVKRCRPGSASDCADVENIVLSADGQSPRRLPATPSWSPDSRTLVVEGEDGTLMVGSPDGSHLRSIGVFPMPSSWSPDAARFIFVRDGNAWLANVDGTGVQSLTNFSSGGVFDAVWSPGGGSIAVIQESQLWILSLDSGDLRPIDLYPGRDSFYHMAWSPDGTRLAVVVGGDPPAMLIVRTADRTVTTLNGTGIDDVAWSPDGRFIALLNRSSKPGQIDVANSDGSGRHTIWTGSDGTSHLTWIPRHGR